MRNHFDTYEEKLLSQSGIGPLAGLILFSRNGWLKKALTGMIRKFYFLSDKKGGSAYFLAVAASINTILLTSNQYYV